MPSMKEAKRQWNTEAEPDVSRDDVGRGRNVWLCLAAIQVKHTHTRTHAHTHARTHTHQIPGDVYILGDESH